MLDAIARSDSQDTGTSYGDGNSDRGGYKDRDLGGDSHPDDMGHGEPACLPYVHGTMAVGGSKGIHLPWKAGGSRDSHHRANVWQEELVL